MAERKGLSAAPVAPKPGGAQGPPAARSGSSAPSGLYSPAAGGSCLPSSHSSHPTAGAQRPRLHWPDGARAVCIALVLLAHYDGIPGLQSFALNAMVPAFFFLAGLFAQGGMARPFGAFTARRARGLLLPYLFYAALSLLVFALVAPVPAAELGRQALNFLLARRNHLFAAALWFLPALFVVAVLYRLAFARLQCRWLRLAICLPVSLAAGLWLQEPMLPLGLNQALRYLYMYALGDALMPALSAQHWKALPARGKAALVGGGVLATAGAAAFVLWQAGGMQSLALPLGLLVAALGCAVALAWGAPAGRVPLLRMVGAYSLVYCGTETTARMLINWLLAQIGVRLAPTSLWGVLALHGLVLGFITVVFVLPIRRFCPALAGKVRPRPAPKPANNAPGNAPDAAQGKEEPQ